MSIRPFAAACGALAVVLACRARGGPAGRTCRLPRRERRCRPSKAAAPAVPVSVAVVEPRQTRDVGRVLRPPGGGRARRRALARRRRRAGGAFPRRRAGEAGRPAGHHRSGALRRRGRSPAGAGGGRRSARSPSPRARWSAASRCWNSRIVSPRDFDQRTNAYREADANLRAAKAALQAAQLNLDYTEVRAPVAGRVGRLEITVGNLVAAGPGAPVLTTLVSVQPDLRQLQCRRGGRAARAAALRSRCSARRARSSSIPVQIDHRAAGRQPIHGRLQLIDNQVDAPQRHGARARRVRQPGRPPDARPVRAPAHGPAPRRAPVLAVSERAIGTDQSKKFVMVVDGDNKAAYREVTLGAIGRRPAHRHQRAHGRRAHRRQRPAARAPRRAGGARAGRHGRPSLPAQAQRIGDAKAVQR